MADAHSRVTRARSERVEIAPYDPDWPLQFAAERDRLKAWFPEILTGRFEHFGSTAVPGLAAKPVVDMLVEVPSLGLVQTVMAPALAARGYEYLWRPCWQNPDLPEYAWFIRRNSEGARTHHIHMLEPDSPYWERVRFRDLLIGNPKIAEDYAELKQKLAAQYPDDRKAYADAKTDFITRAMESIREQSGK